MKYFYSLLLLFILTPVILFAQGTIVYTDPLVGIPGYDPGASADTGFTGYLSFVYNLSIGIAALLAVIKIVIAGIKWMLTDVVPAKGEARKDIEGAIYGLIIILSAIIILDLINPDIVDQGDGKEVASPVSA